MDMNTVHEIATQTISRILGEAAFIFTDNLEQSAKPADATWDADGVSLQFFGASAPRGELRMWVGKGFACYAAANMLGLDAAGSDDAHDDVHDDARSKGMDALKELLNMVVGNFITAVYGDTPVFELGLPKNLSHDLLEKDFANPDAVWLGAEGNPVLFIVETDGKTAP
jgi:Chemotaxis phosphatase CheX